ncbi:hypothetical protein [Streptomyces yangpuensis]|uniref:hypothetical protein n=1 Tax=Streptomyces yangpuensis TaxID=1648182 RepID=UPI00381FD78E
MALGWRAGRAADFPLPARRPGVRTSLLAPDVPLLVFGAVLTAAGMAMYLDRGPDPLLLALAVLTLAALSAWWIARRQHGTAHVNS